MKHMPEVKERADREFVVVVSRMSQAERWAFFVKYIGRHGTELQRARKAQRVMKQVFDSGRCPHCGKSVLD